MAKKRNEKSFYCRMKQCKFHDGNSIRENVICLVDNPDTWDDPKTKMTFCNSMELINK